MPYLKLAYRAAHANFRNLDFPFKLTFCITYWCNYRCKTCNIWKMKPIDELSLGEIETFFRRSNRFSWIDLTGGEVSLRKDFAEIAAAAIGHCRDLLLLHFPTNGYLSDKIVRDTKEIARAGVPKLIITVSLDGDEALNDEIRGVAGGYKRQIETFRRLREIRGVQVVFGMTLSSRNASRVLDTFRAAEREVPGLSPQEFHTNIVHESDNFFRNRDLHVRDDVKAEELASAAETFGRLRAGSPLSPMTFLEQAYLKRVRTFLETGQTPMRCHSLRSSCFIDSWGQVFPCTIYDRALGSLREHEFDLTSIWNSPSTRSVQREIWNYQCPQCWTPCEAYQTIMGNLVRVRRGGPP